MRDGYAYGIHHTDQVNVNRVLEVNRVWISHCHGKNSRIGANCGESTEFLDALCQCVGKLLSVAHVSLEGQALPTRFFYECLGLLKIVPTRHWIRVGLNVLTNVDGDDVGTLAGLLDGMRPALSSTGTRNKGDLSI